MLNVRGMVQREGSVIHIIADRLEDCTPLLHAIGDMPFPHRHMPADGANNGGGPDPRQPKLLQIKDDYSAPFKISGKPELALKSRNFH
jgi:error-prone DNA polymerase